jgi:hypothetical protein
MPSPQPSLGKQEGSREEESASRGKLQGAFSYPVLLSFPVTHWRWKFSKSARESLASSPGAAPGQDNLCANGGRERSGLSVAAAGHAGAHVPVVSWSSGAS